jgi:3-deoxy-D-manno-octulosonic-acid transferase
MFFLYNLLLHLASLLVKVAAYFSPKIKLFVEGRKTVFATLSQHLSPEDKTIWFHAASLGEFEQGLPVMEQIKLQYPNHKIVVTFFSPSGYEVRKNNTIADVTVYLPLDTKANAATFLRLVHPDLVFFIKYEYWPNYLKVLREAGITTYLISGIFRENQAFFKWYGGFYREALKSFAYFFVQNDRSKQLLQRLGYQNVAISGDTRFDRVVSILERDNRLDFVNQFKNGQTTIVIGSSWPKDEALLVDYINQSASNLKFIIAPHNIKAEQIQALQQAITKPTVLFSEREGKDLAEYPVFIMDTIGLLTKIYSYADIAYVGGGFGHPGVHNLLEPATFGIPIVLGPNYSHFAEATALVQLEGCISIKNQEELKDAFDLLMTNVDIRHEKGHICSTFVQMNKGATGIILKHLSNN